MGFRSMDVLIKDKAQLHQSVVVVAETGAVRMVTSAALLGRRDVITILHQGEHYNLRQTRAGRLILTK